MKEADRQNDTFRPFVPAPWIRNPHFQSVFASLKIRAVGKNEMVERAREFILDGGNGVRLLAYHSYHAEGLAKAMVVLLHGWEGSSDSTYILRTGRFLYRRGYDILRLNLRDHGDSHHLNEGMFNGTLVDETVTAVKNASFLSPGLPRFIVGFSLGGNFALRMARSRNGIPVENLRCAICISPLVDPHRSTLIIDSLPLYRHYFLRKWKRSIRRKQELFPHIYQMDDLLRLKSTMEISDLLIRRYSDFKDLHDYFSRYTLQRENLRDLAVPTIILASEDDPVIPVDDVRSLAGIPRLQQSIQRWGGHCGFIESLAGKSWYEEVVYGIIEKSLT